MYDAEYMDPLFSPSSSASRQMIHRYEMFHRDELGNIIPGCYKFQSLITTYEVIISDCLELREIPWRAVIIDEAHRLKNRNCKLLEGLNILDLEHRVLLTGTPLQNNVEELFSLLNFLEPEQFDSEADFLSEFGDLKTEDQVSKLQALLKPMMLRRLKEDVEKNLAPKEETIIEVELTNIQKKYYRAILERNFTFLAKGCGSSSNVPNLMNTMMELRKCCNHPYLIKGAEEKILGEYKDQHGESHGKYLESMVQASGKLVLIDKLLPKLRAGRHKVLIFSQMVRCLDILEDYLVQNVYPYERIDGRVRGNLRQAAIDRFSKPDSDRFVFLLCTRAGGLGINLTAADTVIIFDSDWNPQNDLQAQARCHRIGQSKSVKVYRLLTRATYERDMFDRASLKLGLDKAVLQSMRDNVSGARETQEKQQLSKKDIEELLRKGAYGALMEEGDSDKFCEEDIEQILQRRTQVITIESEGKGSTFAKASFVSRENRTDINIDDPDFWKKWAKKADLDMEELNRDDRIIEMPRVRKQTKRYATSATDEMLDFSDSDTLESDAESEGGGKGKKGKKDKGKSSTRSGHSSGWSRVECFRVEKNLLVYGWGRWSDILRTGRFKRNLSEQEVESIARTMLMYCLQHYKGDEKIKAFIWDLIAPPVDGAVKSYKNHLGLSAPVPRGRKGKKKKDNKSLPAVDMEWAQKINTEELLQDPGYKRHLQHHCNKVLLRVRMLYYLKQEVIGEFSAAIWGGTNHTSLDIQVPIPEGEPPIDWWDEEADKSLLIGVFKHGYEKYNFIRADPTLCFLARCGPPDGKVMAAEQAQEEADADDVGYNDDDQDPEYKPKRKPFQDDEEDSDPDSLTYGDDDDEDTPRKSRRRRQPIMDNIDPTVNEGKLPFPTPSDMNTRLRRIITSYQRSHKKQQLKAAMREKKELLRKERFEEAIRQKELRRREMAQRWSRREEADFYRVVSTFGVEFDRTKQKYAWDRFRSIARLDKKYDQNMTEYYLAFRSMCERVCGRRRKSDEEQQRNHLYVEPITEERASRCLFRIDLLRKVREEILPHPQLEERLKLCLPSHDLPDWWESGKHDKDLLIGMSRHGVSRTEYHILGDPTLSFAEIYKKHSHARLATIPVAQQLPPNPAHLPITPVKEPKDTPSLPNGLTGLAALSPPILKPELPPTLTKMDDLSPKAEPQGEVKEEAFPMDLDMKKEADVKPVVKTEDIKPFIKEEVKDETESKPSMSILERELAKSEQEEGNNEQELLKQEKDESLSLLEQELAKPEKDERASLLERELAKPLEMDGLGLKAEEDSLSSAPLLKPVYQDGEDSQHSFSMDGMGEPTVAQLLSHMQQLRWPKDKVLIQRCDHICQAVLNGKWPITRRIIMEPLTPITPRSLDSGAENSGAATPLGSGTEGMDSTPGDASRFIVKKRKRRKRAEIEADKEAKRRLADMMYEEMRRKMQQASAGTLPSDDQPQDLSMPRSTSFDSATSLAASKNALLKSQDSLLRSPGSLPVMAHKVLPTSSAHDGLALSLAGLVNGVEVPVKKRRGRKPKHDKEEKPKKTKIIINEHGEAIEVEVKRRRRKRKHKELESWSPSRLGPDVPIPVINKVKGERLSGLAAPLNCDLLDWLKEHPGWEVDYPPPPSPHLQDGVMPQPDMEGTPKMKKKRHRCPNPNKLDPDNLTGEERVMVVNRKTGKKIGGLAAPQLMDLDEWLNKNPGFDIAADWEHIAKKYLPVDQHHRIQKNSGKTDTAVTAPFPQQPFGGLMAATRDMQLPAGMASLAGLSAMTPFPGLPGMAMPPMFGFGGLGLPLPTSSTSTTSPTTDSSPQEKASPSSSAAATGTSATSTATSLPTPLVMPGQQGLFWPNPFMMNPAFLPGFLHAGLANGIAAPNTEEQDSMGSLSPRSVKSEGTRSAPSEPVSPSSASPSKTNVTERTNGGSGNSNNNNSNVVSEDTLSPQEEEELNSAEAST
ncbi:CHD7 [Branchiostoma lanceolatum]|uniref:CHD7 protein n=1 Tax=Branchiostoma lanceolatum TaxID=7740 RepID=A0A8S4MQ52_BRALA|nr:CHD7 [Branchiostoma lanceolatum]